MAPILNGCFTPVINKSGEEACIRERIDKFKRDKDSLLTPFLSRTMDEFACHLIPEPNIGYPTPVDEVYDRQSRPEQRRNLDTAHGAEPKRVVKMFLKREAYGKISPPRPIGQINGKDKLSYSQYLYSFTDYISKFPWYAFSKTPRGITDRIINLLEDAEMVVDSDYKRFDGHV